MTLSGGFSGGVEFDDLYQSGYLALVAAVEAYDPARGMSLSPLLRRTITTGRSRRAGVYALRRQRTGTRRA